MPDRDYLDQLRSFVEGVLDRDGHDLESAPRAARPSPPFVAETLGAPPPGSESDALEAIISLHRPVLPVVDDKVDPDSALNQMNAEETAMAKLVKDNATTLNRILPSIGRIDLPEDEYYPWAGTGWIIDSELGNDIVITNAHVAQLFAERSGATFTFTTLPFLAPRKEHPIIDFRHESASSNPRPFSISDVIYIGTPGFLDIAFLRVARSGTAGPLSGPIKLAQSDPDENTEVVTIGYPGTDRGHYDIATLIRIFGNVFDTKRLSPGKLMAPDARGLTHDCSAMPGSSGSGLINPKTGIAVGLHFQGTPFKSNHAVPVSAIHKLIKDRPWQSVGREIIRGRSEAPELVPQPGGGLSASNRQHGRSTMRGGSDETGISATVDADGVHVTVPLKITVRLGGQPPGTTAMAASRTTSAMTGGGRNKSADEAAAEVNSKIKTHPDVLNVRATYFFNDDGTLSEQRGVVVKVRPEASRDAKDYGLESSVGSVPVSIEMADLETLARALAPTRDIAADDLEAPARMQAYRRDITVPKFKLDPIEGNMRVVLHVSPEAGWRELKKFWGENNYNQITIGMYNFTAPHIIDAVRTAVRSAGRQMTLTIDRKTDDIGGSTKADDWPEEKVLSTLTRDAGQRFRWTKASVSGRGKLFSTSYHIKVAVLSTRTGSGRNATIHDRRFWLSSGNWASSNQAPLDNAQHPLDQLTWADVKDYDRDWHAIVENEELARVFRNHLEQDYLDCQALAEEEAAAEAALPDLLVPDDYFLEAPRRVENYTPFPPKVLEGPIKIQPVLTPDNYPEVVASLIQNATRSVLFINQSFDIKDDENNIPEHYRSLLDALLDRQQKGLDVRIIFRSGYGKERDIFRRAVEFGFDKRRIKFYGTCHTKGIVVDGERVLLGSQNWTGAGTKPNRDASLLIDSVDAAKYFTDIFEFDWKNVATDRVSPDHGPTRRARAVASDEEAAIPSGLRLVPWGAWNGD
jgi:V8-like Glu-specific endopeptidase